MVAPRHAAVKEDEGVLVALPGQADFTVGPGVFCLVRLALAARSRAGDPVDAVEPGLDAFAPSPARKGGVEVPGRVWGVAGWWSFGGSASLQIVYWHAHCGRSGNARRTDPRTLRLEAPPIGRWGRGCTNHPVDADEQPMCDLFCGLRNVGVAACALSPCIGVQRQWVRRDGAISCRFRCPGGSGSDTKRNDVAQGFRHAHVGSGGAGSVTKRTSVSSLGQRAASVPGALPLRSPAE
jgi:hypothetical protein